jgi:predicted exporter
MKKAAKSLAVALAVLLALGYVAAGLSRISLNVDILRLLPTHLRQVEGLSLFLKNFALPEELVVTVEATDPAQAQSTAVALATLLRGHPDLVQRAVAEPPWESDPASLSEFLTFVLLNQPPEKIRAAVEALSPEQLPATLQDTLESMGATVSPMELALLGYDPFRLFASSLAGNTFSGLSGASEFSSQDGTFRVVYVQSSGPFANYQQTAEWLKKIKALCAQAVPPDADVKLQFTGEPAFVAEISTSMQRDMMTSGAVTLVLISLIFWLCYGRFLPLFGLLGLLVLIFVLALATTGLVLSELTVVGVGFASVMIGLSVDYGYFIYQKSLRHCGSVRALQWDCLQSIAWTAGTTAAAFFALNFSSLPGLSQLGNMVGIGVCIGALVMLGLFAPLVMRLRPSAPAGPLRLEPLFASRLFAQVGLWATLALVAVCLAALAVKGFPEADFSASTFRPRNSESHRALEQIQSRLQDDRAFLSLVVSGKNEAAVLEKWQALEPVLEAAQQAGTVRRFLSPLAFWPDAAHQAANLAALQPLATQAQRLKNSLNESGFTESAFALTGSLLARATAWSAHPLPLWPTDPASAWILRRLAHHQPDACLALGIVEPAPGSEPALLAATQAEGVHLVSWSTLGAELKQTLPREILNVSLALLLGILLILLVALRSLRAVALFALTTALVLACLAGAMTLLDMKWGFFNLAAILLLLGTGTDYSILILLAFQRTGSASQAQKQFALIIFLCCSSSIAGFGTLGWASNLGLAALGKTCALGLFLDGLISLFLLPVACRLFLTRSSYSKLAPTGNTV